MSFNWNWDREVASWNERRNAKAYNKRNTVTDIMISDEDESDLNQNHYEGEIDLPHKHRRHECEDRDCYDIKACDRNIRRSYEVSLPITITPYALPSEPDACCGGEVRIRHGHKRCDRRSKSHEYTISQIINVEIPIEFGAKICYEDYCSEEHGRCNDE